MASNRHLGRIVAMQTLYELDFRFEVKDKDLDTDEVLERNIARYQEVMDDKAFVQNLVRGVLADTADLDAFIQPLAPEWPLDQIARIDRIVLRMGVWEMNNVEAVPVRVVINEAVELAKGFGADNSSKFVNGVLGTAARKLGKVDEKTDKKMSKNAKPVKESTTSPKEKKSKK